MPFRTLTGTRFTMTSTLLRPGQFVPDPVDPNQYGEWTDNQDPLTGQIVRVWVPYDNPVVNPDTPEPDPSFMDFPCLVRGIGNGGTSRSLGSSEIFGAVYQNIDIVKLWVPSSIKITKRDRVTNIKTPTGYICWAEEEFYDPANITPPLATVFNVNGVIPLFDPFNNHIEDFIMLERAAVQSNG